MRKSLFFLPIIPTLFLMACVQKDHQRIMDKVQRTDDGVIIAVKNPDEDTKLVRLQVINDHIIRVTATASDSFSTEKSLVVLPESKQPTSWKLIEHEKDVVVTTPALHATISCLQVK